MSADHKKARPTGQPKNTRKPRGKKAAARQHKQKAAEAKPPQPPKPIAVTHAAGRPGYNNKSTTPCSHEGKGELTKGIAAAIKCIESRPTKGYANGHYGRFTRRRFECKVCHHRWTTYTEAPAPEKGGKK